MSFPTMAGRALAATALLAVCLVPCAGARPARVLDRHGGALHFSDMPSPEPQIMRRLARAERWRGSRFLGWLPGGGMLIDVHERGRHLLRQLTSPGRKPITLAAPGGRVPWALAPRVGNRVLYAQRSTRGTVWYVLGPHTTHALASGQPVIGLPVWSAHGRRIAFLAATPDGDQEAVYVTAAAGTGFPRLVVGGLAGRWRLLDWSRTGRHVLLQDDTGPDDESLYLGRIADGALRRLPIPAARVRGARFAPGGAAIDYISDQGGQYERLLQLDEASGRVRALSARAPWSVEQFAASPNGHYIAYALDDDGHSALHILNRQLRLDVAVPWLHDGVIGNLQFDSGHRLGLTFQSGWQPPEAYVYDLRNGLVRRWTRGTAGTLATAAPATGRLIHYPTWDRVDGHWRMLSAYVYLPPGPGPAPVLIVLHAGAAGQFRPRWRPFLQFVTNDLGYAVIAPNVRGSAGYGRDFRALAAGTQRPDALRDIGTLMVWIGLQPGFDARRIVVMGRGYGGWLAVNALALFDRHLLGAIDIDGIANLADYAAHGPKFQRQFRAARFGNPQDPETAEYLRRISPIGNVRRILQPVLIVQVLARGGARAADARQLAYLLRFYGDRVELLTATNASSDFTPRTDRRAYRAAIAQFLLALKSKRAK